MLVSPIGEAATFCPLPCPEVEPEFIAPVSPWLLSWSDRSPGGAIGDVPLGGTVEGALLGGPVGPTGPWYCEPGGFGLPGGWVSTCLPSSLSTLCAVREGLSRQGVELGRLGPI